MTAADVVRLFGGSVVLIQVDLGEDKTAVGTGFFVDEEGVVATSLHLLDGAKSVRVRVEGERFEATTVLGFDVERDLVVFEIDTIGFEPVILGETSELRRGDEIFVISNPLGLVGTVSEGIIGAWRGDSDEQEDDLDSIPNVGMLPRGRMLQMSASVSRGSSGAPVFDAYGYVIAVVAGGIGEGLDLNFAIPIEALVPLIDVGSGWDLGSFQIAIDRRRRDLAEPYLTDARFYIAEKDLGPASKALDRALGLYPRSAEALTLKGEVLLAAGQIDEAGELFERAVDLGPDSAEAWENWGQFLLTHGTDQQRGAALVAFENALDLEPWRTESAVGLGIAYFMRGDMEKALEMLQQAVEYDREHLRAWISLGSVAFEIGDLKGAEEAFETAVWLDGDNQMANCGLASIYSLTSDQRESEYRRRCRDLSNESP